jgi:hypothetical protein
MPSFRPTRRLIAAVGLVLAGLAAIVAIRSRRPEAPVPSSGEVLRWIAGTSTTYAFRLETAQELLAEPNQPASRIGGTLLLEGDLELRVHRVDPQGAKVGLRLPRLSSARFEMIEQPIFSTAAEGLAIFAGREAILTLDDRGRLLSIGVPRGAPETYANLIQTIARALPVTAPTGDDARYSAVEEALLGRARSEYTREEAGLFRRERVDFELAAYGGQAAPAPPKISSKGRVRFAAGRIEEIDQTDDVVVPGPSPDRPLFVARFALAMKRRDGSDFVALAALPEVDERAPGAPMSPEALQRRLYEQTAGTITYDAISTMVVAISPKAPPPTGWMTKAVAFLMLHPEHAADLAALFEDPSMTTQSRAYLLDLLASVGHAEAQEAMRTALSSAAAKHDPAAYPMLLQRFSLLTAPDPATVAFLLGKYGTDSGDDRTAALYSLGSTAGALRRRGGDAEVALAKIRSDLDAARATDEKRALVAALGNVGDPRDVDRLARMAKDREPEVRAAVAGALRKPGTDGAKLALIDLAADREARVGRVALDELSRQQLSTEQMRSLAAIVTAPEFSSSLAPQVVSLAAAHPGAEAKKMLEAIVARGGDPQIIARARRLLGQEI